MWTKRGAALGLAAACAVATSLTVAGGATHASAAPASTLPPIGHVWVIELENKGFDEAFSPGSGNPYLSKILPAEGELLTQYYGTGHFSLDNYISEMSGQSPNPDTQGDCQIYQDVAPGTPSPLGSGQVTGPVGCVYPSSVKSLPDQLTEHGDTWHGYMEDLGKDATRDNVSATNPVCGAPVKPGRDGTQSAEAADQYAARHNPFIYFDALTNPAAGQTLSACQQNVGPLVSPSTHVDQLAHALASVATTPTLSFITPNLCDDAHDSTCAGPNLSGSSDPKVSTQGGLFAADLFLRKYVPEITSSRAFKKDGLLIVTLDESAGTDGDVNAACCGEVSGPNTTEAGSAAQAPNAPGGGRIGTVLLSPFIKPGSVSAVPYNHYSMLRSLEDELHLGPTTTIPGSDNAGHLGYAGAAGLVTFHGDVFPAGLLTGSPTAPTSGTGSTSPTAGSGSTTTSSGTSPGETGSPGSELAFTGARVVVPIVALLLLIGAAATSAALRRKEES